MAVVIAKLHRPRCDACSSEATLSFAVLLIAAVIVGVVLIIIGSLALLKLIIGWMPA